MAVKQTEANKRWAAKNRDHANYLSARSRSRGFIKNSANLEDLDELEQLIAERRKFLVKQNPDLQD